MSGVPDARDGVLRPARGKEGKVDDWPLVVDRKQATLEVHTQYAFTYPTKFTRAMSGQRSEKKNGKYRKTLISIS